MIDITRALHAGHPTWPGDTPFKLKQTSYMAKGASVNVMALSTSTHLGTHLDAPFHYDANGGKLADVPLDVLIGPAQVLHALAHDPVPAEVVQHAQALEERVLFFTGQSELWTEFPKDFSPLSPELIYALADKGVRLVGTDSPSVDRFDSKDLPVHKACADTGMYIVEGLNLQGVDQGFYQLLCLPLNLPEADASPVRALLEKSDAP